ncbi:MAG TPA: ChaN family lipoprotein [Bryobacteraceae bacterium]|nr:ChaN family lipoprotein [Bryobacteraceae bacterium]
MKRCVSVVALALMVSLSSFSQSKQKIFHLAIGDPDRRMRDARVVLDGITDSASGDVFTANQLAARLHDTRLLLIGESHTTADFHRVQLRAIRALHEAGRKVVIGLEMFPYTEQKSLDNWRDGLLTEAGFLTLARWYEFWGYHWDYYRDIFLYARDYRIPMYGVNTPRNVVTAVRQKGIDKLSDDERQHVPPHIDVDNADHRAFFQASFDDDDSMHGHMPESMLKSMQAAQATWDASMAYNSVRVLKDAPPDSILVVLAGSGHVAYGVGIEHQARQWFDGKITTLIPVPVEDSEEKPVPSVKASYANFVWGIPYEGDPLYPSLGFSTPFTGARKIIAIEKDSIAARSGFQVNDEVLALDGIAAPDRETWNRLMAAKNWGDSVVVTVKRGGAEVRINAELRRTPRSQ